MTAQSQYDGRTMFQPNPVKSQPSLDGDNDAMDVDKRRQHDQASHYLLENSLHPALEQGSSDAARRQQQVAANYNGRISDGNRDNAAMTPSKRAIYPSDSQFINAKSIPMHATNECHRDGDNSTDGENDVMMNIDVDVVASSSPARVKTEPKEEEEKDNNTNLSDDDSNTDENDQQSTIITTIPTLETYIPKPPTYTKINTIPFAELCRRLELLWNLRFRRTKVSKEKQMGECLLPHAMRTWLDTCGDSPYPYLRLILPDHDSARPHTGMKEARVAETWWKALGLSKGSMHCKQIVNYRNPDIIKNETSRGDLSCVIMDVMKERRVHTGRGSKLTVGEVNEWLDVLVDIVKDRYGMATTTSTSEADQNNNNGGEGGGGVEKSKWRKELEKVVTMNSKAGKHDKYVKMVEKLIQKNLNPTEHKFIIRIILQHIHVGINLRDILNFWHPQASEIYNSFNNLKDLCVRLSDPVYLRLLEATVKKSTEEIMENNRQIWMTPSIYPSVINKTMVPMLSRRTSFHTFLKEIAHRHTQLDKALPAGSPAKGCMAITHPAFMCEIKMDGERDLIHIKRGIVTVQTRRGTWYSPLYSPAIGPALRAAIANYDVDVILDGEMLAWDGTENKPVPFGSNRAVAEMNRNQRQRNGTLDKRDLNLHKNDTDINVMTVAKDKDLSRSMDKYKPVAGVCDDQYWLQYTVFDILYVDGPDAKKLISKSSHLFAKDNPIRTGSLINMDLMQRKSVLFNLIEPQNNIVEHIRSVVVRPDGTSMDAADYFLGKTGLEYGKTPCELDSIYLAMCDKSGTTKFDQKRARGQSIEEIEIERSFTLEQFYSQIVDLGGQEGLLFKDLASPYYLGNKSRSMGYWWKLKPDYDESGGASDLDLIVLGGRYADGFDKRGLVGSIIVGCLDGKSRPGKPGAKFMAVTKVNFNRFEPEKILKEETGFQRVGDNGELQMGKWFESEDIPDFISSESYQKHGDFDDGSGWKPEKKDRPDIWIRPEDSFVVTINAGEFVTSSSFQTGLTLRFPRVSKFRGRTSDDPKNFDQVEEFGNLYTIHEEQEQIRQEEVSFGSQTQRQTSRFHTAKQLQAITKKKPPNRRKLTNEVKQFQIPDANNIVVKSNVLDGFIFSVQPGTYHLESDAFATAEAEENGWAEEAKVVKSRDDVIRFVQSHGGRCTLTVNMGTDFLLGGMAKDAKVANLIKLMTETDVTSALKKDAEARRLIEMGGVLKWSFVFGIVHKFLRSLNDDSAGYEKSIKADCPTLAQPRLSDFLAMSDAAGKSLRETEDKYGLRIHELASSLDFARALENLKRVNSMKKEKQRPSAIFPWQTCAMNDFPENNRHAFGGQAQKLWPYGKEQAEGSSSICILYPDLFDDFGLEEEGDANKEERSISKSPRWKETLKRKNLGDVAATLPLAKALGMIVTPHLHSGVTHVLCDLKRHKSLKWSTMLPHSVYCDEEAGSHLHERLTSLEESASLSGVTKEDILLASPDWLDEKWNEK